MLPNPIAIAAFLTRPGDSRPLLIDFHKPAVSIS